MVLEATVIIVDNSDHMLNGDYIPNRFDAQNDAVSILFQAKTQSNPENTVGLMSMAGKSPEVLVTPQDDFGKILTALHSLKIGGQSNLTTAVNVAQLALKHRQNKNQRQRIIAFVGSPLSLTDEQEYIRLGKRMKKNNVAIDIVTFGEPAEVNGSVTTAAATMLVDEIGTTNGTHQDSTDSSDLRILKAFIESVNSGENSHLVVIPPGPQLISDVLLSSPIVSEDQGESSGPAPPGSQSHEFGVDPSLDPELAMALRMSMEEETARQAAAQQSSSAPIIDTAATHAVSEPVQAATSVSGQIPATPAQTTESSVVPPAPTKLDKDVSGKTSSHPDLDHNEEDDEEAMMQKALAMSVMQDETTPSRSERTGAGMDVDEAEVDEDEEIARAIAMSMQQDQPDKSS